MNAFLAGPRPDLLHVEAFAQSSESTSRSMRPICCRSPSMDQSALKNERAALRELEKFERNFFKRERIKVTPAPDPRTLS